jgi:hypothetical protein
MARCAQILVLTTTRWRNAPRHSFALIASEQRRSPAITSATGPGEIIPSSPPLLTVQVAAKDAVPSALAAATLSASPLARSLRTSGQTTAGSGKNGSLKRSRSTSGSRKRYWPSAGRKDEVAGEQGFPATASFRAPHGGGEHMSVCWHNADCLAAESQRLSQAITENKKE